MTDSNTPTLPAEEIRQPVMKILVTGGTALATLSLVARSTEEAMAARNIWVRAEVCKASTITPAVSQGYALIISTTSFNGDAGIPVIDGITFLSGIHYEHVWDNIANILVKPDLSPA
jgi:galactitol PTS system EIIB component